MEDLLCIPHARHRPDDVHVGIVSLLTELHDQQVVRALDVLKMHEVSTNEVPLQERNLERRLRQLHHRPRSLHLQRVYPNDGDLAVILDVDRLDAAFVLHLK